VSADCVLSFVGREAELDRLREAYAQSVTEGRPQLVAIAGDAGVGKTRLVRELWAWLADQKPQPLQRTGRCLSYGHGIAYWPLAEVLREHFKLRDDDRAEVALERLGRFRYLGLTWASTSPRASTHSPRASGCTTPGRSSCRSSRKSGPRSC
jgi:hypothetical protein